MKKRFYILLIIPLLFISIISINTGVKAEEQTLTVTTKKQKDQVNTGDGLHTGPLYKIWLNGTPALCITPGLRLVNNETYKLLYTIPSVPGGQLTEQQQNLVKAYNYAKNNHGDNIAVIAAQIIAWRQGDVSDVNTVYRETANVYKQYSTSWKQQYGTDAETEARKHINNILNSSVPANSQLSVWKYAGSSSGARQDLITSVAVETPTPPTDDGGKCKIEVQVSNTLPSCKGTGRINSGALIQSAKVIKGNCDGYYKKYNNTESKYGVKESDFGSYCRMYCLKSFYESMPGNIATAVRAGRYVVWPNTIQEKSNKYKIQARLAYYPMITTLTKTCVIMADVNTLNKEYAEQKQIMYDNSPESGEWLYGNKCANLEQETRELFEEANYLHSHIRTEHRTLCRGSNLHNPCIDPYDDPYDNPEDVAKYESKKAEAEDHQNRLNMCIRYGDAYQTAQGIIKSANACVTANAGINLDYSLVGARAEYNDEEYGKGLNLKESKKESKCTNCSSNISPVDEDPNNTPIDVLVRRVAQSQRAIMASTTKYYDLADNYYYYTSEKGKASDTKPSGNYKYIGFSNMPISYKASTKKQYNLSIKIGGATGDAAELSSRISSNDYTCHYRVSTIANSQGCLCPIGTKHSGESLNCKLKINGGYMTCLDAQSKYCDTEVSSDDYILNLICPPTDCTDEECPAPNGPDDPNDLTCPEDPTMDLSPCVNAGASYDKCVSMFCSGDGPYSCTINCDYPSGSNESTGGRKTWVCPKGGTNEGMDLSACVIPMIVKGYNEREAYDYCKDVTCPYGGVKIIYRVIDLSNPFPSYDADSSSSPAQTNLAVGMFNTSLKGRYPGSNWNSKEVVKQKILNNRSTKGDSVYQKTPLYTFVVDSQKIKAIRRYNGAQSQSYADFKLTCKDGARCISSFIRNPISGLSGGTCSGATSISGFDNCAK